MSVSVSGDQEANRSVSVVIPHFNSAATIERAIQSVLNQSTPVSEIIIVDDSSTSDQKLQLKSIADKSSIVKVIWLEKNSGPATARNIGWNAAKGEWIAFLDSDDSWSKDKISIQIQFLNQAESNTCMLGCLTFLELDGKTLSEKKIPSEIPAKRISLKALALRNHFATSTVLIRSELSFRFTAGRKYSEDYELWLRVVASGMPVYKIDLPLVSYYKPYFGESGLSSNMLAMSKGEIETFLTLAHEQLISRKLTGVAISFSGLKSLRRIIIARLRQLKPKKDGKKKL